jgi:hypothetical protein
MTKPEPDSQEADEGGAQQLMARITAEDLASSRLRACTVQPDLCSANAA